MNPEEQTLFTTESVQNAGAHYFTKALPARRGLPGGSYVEVLRQTPLELQEKHRNEMLGVVHIAQHQLKVSRSSVHTQFKENTAEYLRNSFWKLILTETSIEFIVRVSHDAWQEGKMFPEDETLSDIADFLRDKKPLLQMCHALSEKSRDILVLRYPLGNPETAKGIFGQIDSCLEQTYESHITSE